ncbi:restriction endonuclease subunit S [Tabrizicola flagellatus]|uniref:restriction endonuclease subunit S n=1 Tax=Tabrizicola flagellatus TaxID=2593021 RepID=UPI0011F1CD07|nr:restriction endonuclease subunit S [Tabrizicola flagellatus]
MSAGWKQTEIGPVPEDWEVVALGEIGESLIGLTYEPAEVKTSGVLVLRSSNIQNDALAFDDNVYVEKSIPQKLMVQPGDILVCVRNGSRELIGKAALIDTRAEGMTFGAFMAVFRSEIGSLIRYHFQSDILRRQIAEHLGATINQITNKSLNSFRIPLPKDPQEQRAIAGVLGDVDGLIGALAGLIGKKRDLAAAARARLLTGQTRLPGFIAPWQTRRLGELGTFLKGAGIRRDEAASGEIPCVRYGEIYTTHHNVISRFTSFISPAVARTATRLRPGDLLFAASGETKEEIGKCVALADDVEAYAGGDIIILRPYSGVPAFLGHAMNTSVAVRQKANLGQGDAVVHIGTKALASVEIPLPDLAEQTAIAAVLSDMEADIAALEARLAKARALKQALMQALLTGRRRLPLPPARPETAHA